jgi:hypothetical protein
VIQGHEILYNLSKRHFPTNRTFLTGFWQGLCFQLGFRGYVKFFPNVAKRILGIKRHSICSGEHVRGLAVKGCHNQNVIAARERQLSEKRCSIEQR